MFRTYIQCDAPVVVAKVVASDSDIGGSEASEVVVKKKNVGRRPRKQESSLQLRNLSMIISMQR